MAYAIDTSIGPFLNGRVSAQFQLSTGGIMPSAGVVARADGFRSFAALYVICDDASQDRYSFRLAAFKLGKLEALVALKQEISLGGRPIHLALQFFSGEMAGELIVESETYLLRYIMPEAPFPGHCGLIRFYNSAVFANKLHIEEIRMRPILPEESASLQQQHSFCAFLSYSSADKPVVERVIDALRRNGLSYWVDHEQINFGDGVISKIEDGLKRSKFVVVCLSENFAKSGWCRAEYAPILNREFSGDTSRRVIPLSLDGSKNSAAIPLLLSDKMRANFADPVSFTAFLQFLQKSDPAA